MGRETWHSVLGKEMGLQVGRTLGPEGAFAKLEDRGCFEDQKGPGLTGSRDRTGTDGDKAGLATGERAQDLWKEAQSHQSLEQHKGSESRDMKSPREGQGQRRGSLPSSGLHRSHQVW